MWGRMAMSAGALVLLAGAGGGSGRVVTLNREMTSVYDENLKFERREERWKLPAGGAPIIDATHPGYVGIKRDSRTIYLRLAEVITDGATADDACVKTASGALGTQRSHIAAADGFGSKMSSTSAMCIPK